jgi:hypothetical protein
VVTRLWQPHALGRRTAADQQGVGPHLGCSLWLTHTAALVQPTWTTCSSTATAPPPPDTRAMTSRDSSCRWPRAWIPDTSVLAVPTPLREGDPHLRPTASTHRRAQMLDRQQHLNCRHSATSPLACLPLRTGASLSPAPKTLVAHRGLTSCDRVPWCRRPGHDQREARHRPLLARALATL